VAVDEHDSLAERFEAHRTHLRAVAYRMLGSLSEAAEVRGHSTCKQRRPGRTIGYN
jgi:RNA polymerase sigma-70 factor (ECF subfamily)